MEINGIFKKLRLQLRFWFNHAATEMTVRDLHDPEAGAIGIVFHDACKAVGSKEGIDEKQIINAAFSSFVFPPFTGQKGFQNEVTYGAPALESAGRLFAARNHEFIHAMQYQKAAILHADPFNAASPFIIAPEDYVRRKELLEADAYAKGAWLQSLAAGTNPAMGTALDRTPLSAGKFSDIRRQANGLQDTLGKAALAASACEGKWLADGSVTPARDLWHALALEEYERILKARKKAGEENFIFVRMTDSDARDIGTSFGPNPFEKSIPALQLSEKNRQALEKLEASLGISATLPSLGEALAQKGMTREGFIKISFDYTGTEPPQAPVPDKTPRL